MSYLGLGLAPPWAWGRPAATPSGTDWGGVFAETAAVAERAAGRVAETYAAAARRRAAELAARTAARQTGAVVTAEQERSRRTMLLVVGVGIAVIGLAVGGVVLARRRRR